MIDMKIECKNLEHIYNKSNPFEKVALKDINLEINLGEFIGIIGHTGSGKSTLAQHLNGLLEPTGGDVLVDRISTKTKVKTDIRKNVGLVFQYPEYQLFEETCYKDIEFGPKNLGLTDKEIKERVEWACDAVGLDVEHMKEKSPFELSGGQKRRVAIAGVLAMKPKFLVLDEPTAGLDPLGRDMILNQIKQLFEREDMTVILVSHSMEDIAKLCNRVIVIDKSQIFMDDKPEVVFSKEKELKEIGLSIPQSTQVVRRLKEKGLDVKTDCLNVEQAYESIKNAMEAKS